MGNISSVTDISSLLTFILDFFESIIETIKSMWVFITSLFNPAYYTNIFGHLPHPFGSILITLVGFLVVLLLMKLFNLFTNLV